MFDCILLGREIKKMSKDGAVSKLPSKRYRNRRIFQRFDLRNKKVLARNELDFFLVINISSRGFCCEVPSRSIDRLDEQSIHKLKIRHHAEVFILEAIVAWKDDDKCVGFNLYNPTSEVLSFFTRLIKPIEIGISLTLENAENTRETSINNGFGKVYRGLDSSALYLWQDSVGNFFKWILELDHEYISWDKGDGVTTGVVSRDVTGNIDKSLKTAHLRSKKIDKKLEQLAIDCFTAFGSKDRIQLLKTLGVLIS